jgi:hypothetical protein
VRHAGRVSYEDAFRRARGPRAHLGATGEVDNSQLWATAGHAGRVPYVVRTELDAFEQSEPY